MSERDMSGLKIGDLVEVNYWNRGERTILEGLQGEVIAFGIDAGGHIYATVKTGKSGDANYRTETRWLDQPENNDHCIVVHCQDLKVIPEINPEIMAERLFGKIIKLIDTRELYLDSICIISGCNETHNKVAFVNFIGTIYVLPVCSKHYDEYNCSCAEGLDIKPPTHSGV